MKKILTILVMLTILLTFGSMKLAAQIMLDTILPMSQIGMGYDFKTVQISDHETKYYLADTVTNTFCLYNMDFSPFMLNIQVPEPFDMHNGLFQVLYLTRTLFDCDSTNIEYAYYSPSNIFKPFRIMRTDGSLLFKKDSANGPYTYGTPMGGTDFIRPIVNSSSGTKLFLQDNKSNKYIYSLCGTLPTNVFDFTLSQQFIINVYPNPSSKTINFEINLPDNINDYYLLIADNNAKILKKEKVNKNLNTIDIDSLPSGNYYYSLYSNEKVYKTGKFIIIK